MTISGMTNDALVGHALEGRYQITERLARGGMATVYLATDLRLTRTVAIKVMHVGLGDDDDFARKFDREARSAAKLSHPNVVSVFDQGMDNGRPYIVMEYVHGRTLRSVMRKEAVPNGMDPVRALTIMEAVLCALAAAHESGLVHRDVKPENVLISDTQHVKVADFGLAKAVTAQTSTATAGLLIGTVSYLPPELVTSGKADQRSDVYSAGVVLFEMLTGRKPHSGDTPIQVAYSHVHNDVPPPSSVVPTIPDYLDALVRHATAREPYLRTPDARTFLHELRTVRAKLRSGATADAELTEIIATGSPAVDEWDDSTGIRTRRRFVPSDYNPRTQLSPASPRSPDSSRTAPLAALAAKNTTATSRAYAAVAPAPRPTGRVTARSSRTPSDLNEFAPALATPVAPARPAAELRHRKARRRGVIALLLVLALTATAGIGSWWYVTHRTVAIPAAANLTKEQATAQIFAAGLSPQEATEYSETVPAGRVIRTDPAAGVEVSPGDGVTIVVSQGPERYAVPKLITLKLADAQAALAAAHLKSGKVTEVWDDKVAAGIVTAASVKEGTMARPNDVVDLTVSKGPEPIKIPDWTGKSSKEATAALEKLGFKVAVTSENHDTIPAGAVISQNPKNGTGKRGDTITIVESKGPVMVVVPNVWGQPLAKATKTLQDAGFKVKRQPLIKGQTFGLVSRTDPAGGTMARKGATVTMYYV